MATAHLAERTTRRSRWGAALVGASVILLSACGGGGSGPGGRLVPGAGAAGPAMAILPATLPALTRDTAVAVDFSLQGAAGAATWTLDGGRLPTGMQLTSEGRLEGVPTERGVFTVGIRAQDGIHGKTRTYVLAVDRLALYMASGHVGGEAWGAHAVELRVVGQQGTVDLEAVGGGSIQVHDAQAGHATWTPPAPTGGAQTVVLRVTEQDTGRRAETPVTVRPDPVAGHRADFGFTDVWYVDDRGKVGAHPFATDLHAALAANGLRRPDSVDDAGTEVDRLACLAVRSTLLRHLSTCFLRDASGSEGAAGLAISFPWAEPDAAFHKPSVSGMLPGGPGRFSVISLVDGTRHGVVGTAWLDGGNQRHENNTSSAAEGEFGVFVNRVASYVRAAHGVGALVADPIRHEDRDTLQAILHGEVVHDARGQLLQRAIGGLGQALASVCAHEIGHSLGFDHTEPAVPGAVMNAYAAIGPGDLPTFEAHRIQTLRQVLPGPGRLGYSGKTGAAVPWTPGVIEVCSGDRCDLRLPPAGVDAR